MSQGPRSRPVLGLIAVFGLLPAVFVLLVFMPVQKRMDADRARLEAAVKRNQELPNVQPLTSREKALLEDPQAPWRSRIATIGNDAQRLAHYHRVVTGLQRELKGRGIALAGVRSEWSPIKGSFTLPPVLGATLPAADLVPPAGRLHAWVLEAQVNGPPADLFKALEALPRISPILEPVALRWAADPTQHKQVIVLRNLVSLP